MITQSKACLVQPEIQSILFFASRILPIDTALIKSLVRKASAQTLQRLRIITYPAFLYDEPEGGIEYPFP